MISNQALKRFGLFKGLENDELAQIAKLCRERKRPSGTICFVQGKKAAEVHLCRSGQVDIVIQLFEPAGTEVTIHTIKEGDVFGWSALMKPHISTSSAKCVGTVDDVYIKGSDLLNLFEQDQHIGYIVMRNLSNIIHYRLTQDRQRLGRELSPDFHL